MASYDEAVSQLYRAPHEGFVAERKRLAAELKAGGDKAAAARFIKLGRPPISAWAVNQLWWHEQESFRELLDAAAKVRAGARAATSAHREALARLRTRAGELLLEGGHGAAEGTLRRVTATLSALAAAGGFDPDPPGALAADRDPPGFEALGVGFVPASAAEPAAHVEPAAVPVASEGAPRALEGTPASDEGAERERAAEAERLREEDARRRAAEEAERRRQEEARWRAEEEARARLRAERERLEKQLDETQSALDARLREVAQLRTALVRAEEQAERAKAAVAEVRSQLARLTGAGDTSGAFAPTASRH
jgi:hypothetical protein